MCFIDLVNFVFVYCLQMLLQINSSPALIPGSLSQVCFKLHFQFNVASRGVDHVRVRGHAQGFFFPDFCKQHGD